MHYDWVHPTLERIADLLRMPDQNNSYGTPKIEPRLAWESLRLVWLSANACTPAPVISPTKAGGIVLNWSGKTTIVAVNSEPGKPIMVVTSGIAFQQGQHISSEQVLSTALRLIEVELDVACPEAVQA